VFDSDPGVLARYTRVDGYPAILDFALQSTVTDVVGFFTFLGIATLWFGLA